MKLCWFSSGPYPAMEEELFLLAVGKALSYWSACCDLQFERTMDPRAAQIIFCQARPYPQGQALGYMCSKARVWPVSIVFHTTRQWVIAKNPNPGELDAVRVIAHEVGHAILGEHHLPDGNLMSRGYNLMARTPQEADVRQAIGIYGPPRELPKPVTAEANP